MDVCILRGGKRESGCFSKVVCVTGRVGLELGTRASQFRLSRVHWGQFWSISCSSQVTSLFDYTLFPDLKIWRSDVSSPGVTLFLLGEQRVWEETCDGRRGCSENRRAADCGHDFTLFHWVYWMKMELGSYEGMREAALTPESSVAYGRRRRVSAGRMESLSRNRLCKKPLSHYISSMDPQPGIFTDCLNLLFNFHKINWICKKRSSNYFWKKTPLLKVFKRPCSLLLARDFFLMLQHLLLFQLTWSSHPTGPFLFSPPGSKASSRPCAGCGVMGCVPPLPAPSQCWQWTVE